MDNQSIQNINANMSNIPSIDVSGNTSVSNGNIGGEPTVDTMDFQDYYTAQFRKQVDAIMQQAQLSAGVGSVLPDAGTIQPVQLQPQIPQFSAGDATIGFNAGNVGQLEAVSLVPNQAGAVYGVIAAEALAGSVEDARAVADVIINRCRSGAWGGKDPLSVVSAPNQFSVWKSGAYKVKSLTPEQIAAVNDEFNKAAAGLPTTYGFQSFRSSGSTGYSNTQVVPGGNRYR